MTDAFAKFMKQFQTQGRDYGDGYDRSHFQGLTQDEEAEVIRLLSDAAKRGDAVAIDGLATFGTACARDALLPD